MRKGFRTEHLCKCGCQTCLLPVSRKKDGRVNYYPKFFPGHGASDWGKRLKERIRRDGHPCSLPIGSVRETTHGYRLVKTEEGWLYEHRVTAKTPKGMQTHHKDGVKNNNCFENLMVLSNSAHQKLHGQIVTWSRKFACCIECGTTGKKHLGFGLCSTCYQKKPRSSKFGRHD